MSDNMVNCFKCKAQKKYVGIGGIERDCEACDGNGRVKKITLKPAASVVAVEHVEPVASVASVASDKPIFAGYDDELMRAVLDEPNMTTENWRLKYTGVSIATSVRERHSIREMYAQSQLVVDRKVNLSASQDAAIEDDADYKKFVADEKKLVAKAKATKSKAPIKKTVKKSGVGGV